MSSNPNLYRYIDWIGGNVLDASNVTLLQTELGRIGLQGLGQLYSPGTLLNAVFNITGTSIVFTQANATYNIFVFVNGQFESLGTTVTINGTQPTSGASNPLYLNWSWNIVTSTSDPTFIDGITGEPTIEAGQLSLQVSWVDTSGVSINPAIQFAKNTSPIILAEFNMVTVGAVSVSYVNGVYPYAWGTPEQAGLVSITPNSSWVANSSLFTLGQTIVDTNGNVQIVTQIGTTGASHPSWNVSGTTTDNTVIWTFVGVAVSGEAVNANDVSITNARNPKPLSVYNSSVAPLISSGTNSSSLPGWAANTVYNVATQIVDTNGNVETVVDVSGSGTSGSSTPSWSTSLGGTTVDNAGANQITWINGGTASTTRYSTATTGQGGIFTDSIIYTTLSQKLTTFLDTVNTNIENALIALSNHIGKPLGTSETHPFPTALQVGAAPASHVGQVLGLTTSHPAQVNSDHSGFVVQRNPAVVPNPGDAAYLLTDGTNTLAAILHDSDVFANLPNTANAQGGNGAGGTAVYTGTLGLMSLIANVLAEHVNYKTHGNNNPHNLDAADIGSVSAAIVDAELQDIVSDVTSYTDSRANVTIRTSTTNGRTIGLPVYGHQSSSAIPVYSQETITYVIANFGGGFEIALGTGVYSTNGQVALPEASGWSSGNLLANASTTFAYGYPQSGDGIYQSCYYNPSNRIVTVNSLQDGGNNYINTTIGWATVYAFGWRFITAAPFIISAYDSTGGTFNTGSIGDTVVIAGRNFGSIINSSYVTFNGTQVNTYVSWSSTSVIVIIPSGATTGVVGVNITGNGTATSSFVFTIV